MKKPHYRKVDLTGKRIGHLVVVSENGRKNGRVYWLCLCDCGRETCVISSSLISELTKSCGCSLKNRAITESKTVHGHTLGKSNSSEYATWSSAIARCTNPKNRMYPNYGGRGITVCDRWRTFSHFLEDMGLRPSPVHSLDRIDNDGPYSPENCRWATTLEQANNKTMNRIIEFDGERLTVSQWARKIGLQPTTITRRLKLGWSIEDALTRPLVFQNVRRKGSPR
jgi:hypothetical protein